MNSQYLKKLNIPDKPGVYFFLKKESILYIGKATSLKDRIRSYLGKDIIQTRGPIILDMVTQADGLKWQETDSVLEALILEANLIKKHQPKYNTKEKDNKSFNYVCITDEEIPKIIVRRGRDINFAKKKFFSSNQIREIESASGHLKNIFFSKIYGPFPNGRLLKEAMKIIRRIFPYIDHDSIKKQNKEFYKQLGLAPEFSKPGLGIPFKSGLENFSASLISYRNNIKNLELFFGGKKKNIISNLKKEMMYFAKNKDFEKANEIKKRIFALEHINDVSLIKEDFSMPDLDSFSRSDMRIEAYDVAHMSGKNMVGVMVVIEDGEIKKSEYKKFIIKTQANSNDTGALKEVLERRFNHQEWRTPEIIIVDGGISQINIAKKVIKNYKLNIPVIGVVKDEKHKPKSIIGDELLIKKEKKNILLANYESHRFAINFHKKRRKNNFIKKIAAGV